MYVPPNILLVLQSEKAKTVSILEKNSSPQTEEKDGDSLLGGLKKKQMPCVHEQWMSRRTYMGKQLGLESHAFLQQIKKVELKYGSCHLKN